MSTYRIDADVLIPGRGAPVDSGCVILEDAVITYAGSATAAPATPGAVSVHLPAVMPGLWDCHAHFLGLHRADVATLMGTSPHLVAMRAVKDAAAAIDAGVTSVREVGGLGVWVARAVEEGTLPGPSVYAAGAILSPTGGHADLHMFPIDWVEDFADRVGLLRTCDGVAECLRAVRLQLRVGARVIKICASGGVMSEIDHPIHQQFQADELRAIVEEAGLADRVVAAHCDGKPGIMAALAAGVRTIEHDTYLDEEAAAAMRECGAILVPTRHIVEEFLAAGVAAGMPDYARRKLEAIADRHAEAISYAHENNVKVAVGTDIACSVGPDRWGQHGAELGHLVRLGFSPLEAIEAATSIAPETLGPQAPRAGFLAQGYDADVIGLAADPTHDVSVLATPSKVTHVWRRGELLKGPSNHE